MLQVYLVRHGETQWNAERRIQGQSDSPLTAHGERQAWQVGERARTLGITHIITSDLGRTRRTAEIIAEACGCSVIADARLRELDMGVPEFAEAEKAVQDKIDHLMNIKGKKSVDSIHKELGRVMWEYVGMGRTAEGLKTGLAKLKDIRKEFETELFIPGSKEGLNVELDKAFRLNDFITMGELIAYDALNRNESCGGHFREEYQTEEGEAKRDDENFFYVACWEYQGSDDKAPVLYKEPLVYEAIKVQTRNYKS